MIEAFPLQWPQGWKRTPFGHLKSGQFKATFETSRRGIIQEIKLLGGVDPVISTNQPLRTDGYPFASKRIIRDPGVAVYFKYKNKPMVFACDNYIHMEHNLRAIELTINALRGINRWGASDMLERAFTGFTALPSGKKDWWEVLSVREDASENEIKAAYRALATKNHPDQGGSHDEMAKINEALSESTKVFS